MYDADHAAADHAAADATASAPSLPPTRPPSGKFRPPLWERQSVVPQSDAHRTLFVERIKAKQLETIALFRSSASAGLWREIHNAHFDWWMFPIDDGSKSAFNLRDESDVEALRADPDWLPRFREAVTLMLEAWGWEVTARRRIPPEDFGVGQGWSDWDVRQIRAPLSFYLFWTGVDSGFPLPC